MPNIAQVLHSSSNTAGINAVYLKNVMLEQWTRPWLMIGARECEQSEQIYFGTLVCTGSGGRINITQPLFRGWWRLRHFTFLKYQILKLRADSILSKKMANCYCLLAQCEEQKQYCKRAPPSSHVNIQESAATAILSIQFSHICLQNAKQGDNIFTLSWMTRYF